MAATGITHGPAGWRWASVCVHLSVRPQNQLLWVAGSARGAQPAPQPKAPGCVLAPWARSSMKSRMVISSSLSSRPHAASSSSEILPKKDSSQPFASGGPARTASHARFLEIMKVNFRAVLRTERVCCSRTARSWLKPYIPALGPDSDSRLSASRLRTGKIDEALSTRALFNAQHTATAV